ncbi:hypothetical protein RND71_021625 [Anisodus tanguticus]|uniref:Uncharacterized protein n=1 Tax=Anisodus tanguticus TaxID=243964 RepID=A0AAE1VD24_9SOLA|nr:hypothetical protein RND71_021625 [Anisodus tanguticus]
MEEEREKPNEGAKSSEDNMFNNKDVHELDDMGDNNDQQNNHTYSDSEIAPSKGVILHYIVILSNVAKYCVHNIVVLNRIIALTSLFVVLIICFIGDVPVMLAKPQTFMNASGESVGAIVSYYKIPLKQVLVDEEHYESS